MIPTDRPVLGRDLEAIAQAHGLQASDAIWMLGLTPNKWSDFVRAAPEQPVGDPTLALLVRILDQNPELRLIPEFPTPAEMRELFVDQLGVSPREFSVLMGFQATAGDRWIRMRSRISATTYHLFWALQRTLQQLPKSEREKFIAGWRDTVAQEASTRGVEDVFRAGSWSVNAANDEAVGEAE
ncbi:hypothetical protein [Scleromatobacter humisilvae]|uniref:Uncharacterized protein n=1 Tax=Scleromatobacter humisilvae TaxID=2897159 RepID=A0A9X2C2X7_9BURK|nr:hypothetical protein [Scleromatobacter humisilvae]MCK9687349.1 hypothetical protein [Scleromatobacter humisilvae]